MSVSKKPESIADLLAREDKELRVAQQRHAAMSSLLKALPEDSPVPSTVNDFGYCAEASLTFQGEGLVQRLLALYPPLPLVDVTDGSRSQKPRSYLRDNEERGLVMDIHPVLLKCEGKSNPSVGARWWTNVGNRDVEVSVKGIQADEVGVNLERFTAHVFSYATGSCTFYVRKVLAVDGRLDALELWKQAWSDFSDRSGYSPRQRFFVNALSARCEHSDGAPVSQADLPEPQYLVGGTALAIPEGASPAELLAQLQAKQAARKPHPWDRLGDFHALFTPTQAQELLAFANEQGSRLAAARQQAQAEFDLVRAWLTEFFATRGPVLTSEYNISEYVQQLCRKATGLAVQLGVGGRGMKEVAVSARIGTNRDTGRHLSLACRSDLPALRPQDLPVEYV